MRLFEIISLRENLLVKWFAPQLSQSSVRLAMAGRVRSSIWPPQSPLRATTDSARCGWGQHLEEDPSGDYLSPRISWVTFSRKLFTYACSASGHSQIPSSWEGRTDGVGGLFIFGLEDVRSYRSFLKYSADPAEIKFCLPKTEATTLTIVRNPDDDGE